MKKTALVMVILAGIGFDAAWAADQSSSVQQQAFIKKAAVGGMAEVELGKLAESKASSPKVKDFGQQMVTDHSKANDELQAVAAKKNVTLPQQLDAKHTSVRDRLAKQSNKSFDRAYVAAMVADHKEDVAEFERASKSSDPDVKAFAVKTLPTLREHLKMAKQLQSSL